MAALETIRSHRVPACFDTDYYSDIRGFYSDGRSFGENCGYYATNDTTKADCGRYDTDAFRSSEMCCACGGGLTREVSIPIVEPVCQDSNTDTAMREITDSYGDGCAWYESKISNTFCGEFDTDQFFAEEMCCACGGGFTAG